MVQDICREQREKSNWNDWADALQARDLNKIDALIEETDLNLEVGDGPVINALVECLEDLEWRDFQIKVIKKVLDNKKQKVNLELTNKMGETPFYRACRYGLIDIAKLLIEHGANINPPNNKYGESIMQKTKKYDRPGAVDFLKSLGIEG